MNNKLVYMFRSCQILIKKYANLTSTRYFLHEYVYQICNKSHKTILVHHIFIQTIDKKFHVRPDKKALRYLL